MDFQWLASFILEFGFAVQAYRLVKQLQRNQLATDLTVKSHAERLGVLELRHAA